MTDRRMLLVTGSRSLGPKHGGTSRSFNWAYDILRSRIIVMGPDDIVINGGAWGPDNTSTMIAAGMNVPCEEFRLDGNIYAANAEGSRQVVLHRWRDADGPVVSPLERNRALVAAAVKARNEGWHVHVLGLIAPWTKTHGTAHTLAQAAHFGLEVTRLECPAAYGPETSL